MEQIAIFLEHEKQVKDRYEKQVKDRYQKHVASLQRCCFHPENVEGVCSECWFLVNNTNQKGCSKHPNNLKENCYICNKCNEHKDFLKSNCPMCKLDMYQREVDKCKAKSHDDFTSCDCNFHWFNKNTRKQLKKSIEDLKSRCVYHPEYQSSKCLKCFEKYILKCYAHEENYMYNCFDCWLDNQIKCKKHPGFVSDFCHLCKIDKEKSKKEYAEIASKFFTLMIEKQLIVNGDENTIENTIENDIQNDVKDEKDNIQNNKNTRIRLIIESIKDAKYPILLNIILVAIWLFLKFF